MPSFYQDRLGTNMGKALTKGDDNEFFAGRYGPYYSTRSTDSGEHTNSIPLIAIGTQGTKLGLFPEVSTRQTPDCVHSEP